MRRLDDVLRILASVLIGVLCRDFRALECGVRTAIDAPTGRSTLSFLTVAVFLALCVRNVHGSAAYDEWAETMRFVPPHERRVLGRMATFTFSLVGLFVAPFAVDYCLKFSQLAVVGVVLLASLPWLPYVPWNLALWLGSWSRRKGHSEMRVLSTHWLRVDAAGFLVLSILWIVHVYLAVNGQQLSRAWICRAFVGTGVFTIAADYLSNLRFYFPRASYERR